MDADESDASGERPATAGEQKADGAAMIDSMDDDQPESRHVDVAATCAAQR